MFFILWVGKGFVLMLFEKTTNEHCINSLLATVLTVSNLVIPHEAFL